MTRAMWFATALALAAILLTAPSGFGAPASQGPSLHPPVYLLDRDGKNVRDSGKPISTMKSCAGCHNTEYIATHNYHAAIGHDDRRATGVTAGRRAWDYSPGPFGRWNPLVYRYLSPPGHPKLDLGIAEWLQRYAQRHVGGGPAVTGHGSRPLDARAAGDGIHPDTFSLDQNGRPRPWNWKASGTVELNCFLCHTDSPDNQARLAELERGRFEWANTATLDGRQIVEETPEGWFYRPGAFRSDGTVDASRLGLRAAKAENCGLCHGQVHFGSEPLELDLSLRHWSTATKGQVFSPQRISESALNIEDKPEQARAWDVHAERLLDCTSCHFSLNHPADYSPVSYKRLAHLEFDPRRLTISEYLYRPSHQLAKGHTAQGTVARHLDGTMRGCADCHEARTTHAWLPYIDAHLNRLSCEACHAAEVHAPAIRQADWTLLLPPGEPRIEWRGLDGRSQDPAALVTGFRPVLLPRQDLDGRQRLVPHNLVTSWYWVENGPNPRPVRLVDLKAALLAGNRYHPELVAALDADRDSLVSSAEARLDTPEKVEAARRRLLAVGVQDPQIRAEVQPYGIHHGVGPAATATRQCETCHAADSRLGEPLLLASAVPGGVMPELVDPSVVRLAGELRIAAGGQLSYVPSTREASLYVVGHDRWPWVNWLGGIVLAGVLSGVAVHSVLRILAARRGRNLGSAVRQPSRREGSNS